MLGQKENLMPWNNFTKEDFMKKNKKNFYETFDGCTAQDLFDTMNKLASSAEFRKETEEWFKKKGMDITIDKCGLASLYTPFYVSDPTGEFSKNLEKWNNINSANSLLEDKKKYPKECECENCLAN